MCLILLDSLSACGGSVEATPDAGTVAPPTKPDASVDWLPPSEHWIQIELAFINACLLSDKGNLRYFGEDQYSSPLSFNEGAFKGLSASTTGEMFAAWTKNHVNFFGNTELYQSPTNWLEPPSGNIEKLIPLSQEGYCYFSEPLPSVPHCNIGSDLGFPTDVKFIDVAGRWNAIPRTAGDRALLLGITAEGKLWCTRHGDDCHAAFGLKPEEKVKKLWMTGLVSSQKMAELYCVMIPCVRMTVVIFKKSFKVRSSPMS